MVSQDDLEFLAISIGESHNGRSRLLIMWSIIQLIYSYILHHGHLRDTVILQLYIDLLIPHPEPHLSFTLRSYSADYTFVLCFFQHRGFLWPPLVWASPDYRKGGASSCFSGFTD